MALPKKLIKFNMFSDGDSWIGEVSEITLPKLAWKTEEYQGSGMITAVAVPLGVEPLEAEINFGGIMEGILKQFGIFGTEQVSLRFVGSYQALDQADVTACEIVMKGFYKEIDMGSAKQGEDTEFKATATLTYYKLTIGGDDAVEIDSINGIFKTNGVDKYAKHNEAIGA